MIEGLPGELLEPPVNVMRLALHPEGMAPRIANLAEWRAHLLHRLGRQIALTGDASIQTLYDEVSAYPAPSPPSELPPPIATIESTRAICWGVSTAMASSRSLAMARSASSGLPRASGSATASSTCRIRSDGPLTAARRSDPIQQIAPQLGGDVLIREELEPDLGQRLPLVDGTAVPSMRTASRNDLATPLNDASIT